jgi:hypothetical protein
VSSKTLEALYPDLSSNLLLFPACKLQISSALYFSENCSVQVFRFFKMWIGYQFFGYVTLCQWVCGYRRYETEDWPSNVGKQIPRTSQKKWYFKLLYLGWYQALFPPTIYMRSALFWNIMQRRGLDLWSLNTRPIGCTETSERTRHSILHNILQRVQNSCNFFEAFIRWDKLGIDVGTVVNTCMSLFTARGQKRVELYNGISLNRSAGCRWMAHVTLRPPYPAKGNRISLE